MRNALEGRIGFEVYIREKGSNCKSNTNLVSWYTKKPKYKIASTTSAELRALQAAVKKMPCFVNLINALWKDMPTVHFYIDNNPVVDQLISAQAKSDPDMQGILEYCIQQIKKYNATYSWIETKKMLADRMTKFLVSPE